MNLSRHRATMKMREDCINYTPMLLQPVFPLGSKLSLTFNLTLNVDMTVSNQNTLLWITHTGSQDKGQTHEELQDLKCIRRHKEASISALSELSIKVRDPSPQDCPAIEPRAVMDKDHKRFTLFSAVYPLINKYWGRTKNKVNEYEFKSFTLCRCWRVKGMFLGYLDVNRWHHIRQKNYIKQQKQEKGHRDEKCSTALCTNLFSLKILLLWQSCFASISRQRGT